MLRSRGNRLPSERAELAAASLSSPSRSIGGGRRACRGSRSIVAAAPRLSPLPLSYSAAARPSRSIARRSVPRGPPILLLSPLVIPRVREEKDRVRTRFPSSLSRTYPRPIVFIVLWISPPSSATARRAGRRRRRRQSPATGAHAHIRAARRIVPAENRAFFRTPGRDSSPISFRSPVIN